MTKIDNLDSSAQKYFYSLPSLIQEQIIESGVTFNSKEDIEKYYNSVTGKNDSRQN